MSVHFNNALTQLKNEGFPALINTVGTGALTYLGQQAPKAVEFLNFNMSMEALAGGSVFVSAAGSLMNVLGNTFAADSYKKPAIQAAAYAFAAFGSAYFLPQVATMAGLEVAFENAMALALTSTLVNAARVFMPAGEKKPAEKDATKPEDLKKMKDEDFAKISKKEFSDAESGKIAKARNEVVEKKLAWNAAKYDEVVKADKDGNFDITKYEAALKAA